MPGVEIGDEVVIGANSQVTKNLPSNVVAVGSPAKVIVKNYPKPLSQQQILNIFNQIILDFIGFLEFNNFEVNYTKMDENISIFIKKNNKKHEIFILFDVVNHSFSCTDNLLVDYTNLYNNNGNNNILNKSMELNMNSKVRTGNSKIGEEFVNFLSRYGVRFIRPN